MVGVKYEQAMEEAEKTSDYQLLKAVEEEFSNDVPEGYIASQFPEAYTEEVQGYSLYITVSKGAKMRTLPQIEEKQLIRWLSCWVTKALSLLSHLNTAIQ